MSLEPKECQKHLRELENLFLRDNDLYHKASINGSDINQLVLPVVYHDIVLAGLHDGAGHLGRDRTV